MLGLKTLLRLVIAAAVITGGLYGVMEFGRPQAGQGPQADLRPAEGTSIAVPKPSGPAVPEIRPSMEAAAPAPRDVSRSLVPEAPHQATATQQAAPPAAEPAPVAAQAAVQEPAAAPVAPSEPAVQDTAAHGAPAAAPAGDVAAAEPQAEPSALLPATGALSDPADEPAPAAAPEKPKKVKTAKGSLICTTFRSYNAESGTYRGLDGKVHDCKPPPLH